jgi:predicted peptidase
MRFLESILAIGVALQTVSMTCGQSTEDVELIAPLDHQFNEDWVGGIVPAYLIDMFEPHQFRFSRGRRKDVVFHYRLFRPDGVELGTGRQYPLLVWTSGYGEMGRDNFAQLRHLQFVFQNPQSKRKSPFFCIVMQSPATEGVWFDEQGEREKDDVASVLMELVNKTMKEQPIDPNRVYLSGVSAGGSVCWELVMRHPKMFAAVAPMACNTGEMELKRLEQIVHVPVWVFHSTADPVAPPDNVRNTVENLKKVGGRVALTEIDSEYHDCWTAAFQQYNLKDWLLRQKRGEYSYLYPPGRKPVNWLWFLATGVCLCVVLIAIKQELRRRNSKTI